MTERRCNTMNFRELEYVTAIARHKNISHAAESLHISQPTLTKFLQNLEKQHGQPLFKKMGRKTLPTYAGERYVERARQMLDIHNQLQRELADIIKDNIGELKIALPSMRSTYMLPLVLPLFKAEYPNVTIKVHEADSIVLEDMLLRGEIDIAFFNLPVKSDKLAYSVLCSEEIVLLMSREHPLAQYAENRPECAHPWIDIRRFCDTLFIIQKPDQRMRKVAARIFHQEEMQPASVLELRNITAGAQLAARGYGVCLVDHAHLQHIALPDTAACFSIGQPHTYVDFAVAWRQGVYLPEYAHALIEIVKKESVK